MAGLAHHYCLAGRGTGPNRVAHSPGAGDLGRPHVPCRPAYPLQVLPGVQQGLRYRAPGLAGAAQKYFRGRNGRFHAPGPGRRTSRSCAGHVRFLLSAEISTIYRGGDRARKAHHLTYALAFESADRITEAHSPPMLGREATTLSCDPDYFAMARAFRTGEGRAGTREFFPEEGNYHLDGSPR